MTEKMKPCPFCGNPAKLEYGGSDFESEWWFVSCSESEYQEACDCTTPIYDSHEKAIDFWNTRPREPQWISVEDRLPEDLKPVLVKGESDNKIRKCFDMCWRYDGEWQSWHVRNITHWMPLPHPPESEETK